MTAEAARNIICHIPRLPLLPALYRLDLWCAVMSEEEDYIRDGAVLRVEPGRYFSDTPDARLPRAETSGHCMIPQRWGAPLPPLPASET